MTRCRWRWSGRGGRWRWGMSDMPVDVIARVLHGNTKGETNRLLSAEIMLAFTAAGYAVVPIEPTDAQKKAGSHAWENCPSWGDPEDIDPRGVADDCADVYRAMVNSLNQATDTMIAAATKESEG
jgi:hypothetical protein